MRAVVLWCAALLVLAVVGLSGCAKRPVVYRDPSFSGKLVRAGPTAFLLPEKIDIQAAVADFVVAFDGHPSDGIDSVRAYLTQYLAGEQKVSPSHLSPGRFQLRFIDLDPIGGSRRARQMISLAKDDYGVVSLAVSSPDSLSAILATANIDYLIVLDTLVVAPGFMQSGAAGQNVAYFPLTMTSQAFVWSRGSKSVILQSFITGKSLRAQDFGLQGLCDSFACDLWWALE